MTKEFEEAKKDKARNEFFDFIISMLRPLVTVGCIIAAVAALVFVFWKYAF